MYFDDAFQADIVLVVGNEKWKVPRFTIEDFIDWGSEVDSDREARATAGMEEAKKFEYIAYHDIPPSNLDELIRLIGTPKAVQRICAKCLGKGCVVERKNGEGVFHAVEPPEALNPDRIRFFQAANTRLLTGLAKKLASCGDRSITADTENAVGGESPLTGGGTANSLSGPATGSSTSASSTPVTPAETRESAPSASSTDSSESQETFAID